jgi:HSP20 family protein
MDVEPWREMETKLAAFTPRVNVADEPSALKVTAELPGMAQEDIQLSIRGGYLTLRGVKKEEREEVEGKNYRHTERLYGEFERVIPLQAEVDSDKVEAVMKNGVLTITLPKIISESERERKISIKAR